MRHRRAKLFEQRFGIGPVYAALHAPQHYVRGVLPPAAPATPNLLKEGGV